MFVALTTGMGSFDSQASRERDARFAQDDSIEDGFAVVKIFVEVDNEVFRQR